FEAAGGAVRLGDLVCSLNPSVLIRGVAEKRARYYGTLLIAPFVGVVAEAYSRFQDGSSLTTTTNAFPGGGAPEAKIHWNPIAPGTAPSGVVEAHLAAVEEHVVRHDTTVTPVRQNLLSLAEAIEEFLVRRTGA
ncbi:MAG: hypothetical protein HKO53_15745, partial [Gemmatimonadetes bacterium]|nr:hypothetical protein [Gemmatimonadota bacterium]